MIGEIRSILVKSALLPKGKRNACKLRMEQTEEDVIDLLSLIPPEIVTDGNEDIDEHHEDRLHQDGDEEINSRDVPMNVDANVSTSNQGDCNILQEIVNRLNNCPSSKKWKLRSLDSKSLFQKYLANAESIDKSFTVAELHKVGDVYAEFIGKPMCFKKSDRKCVLVNEIRQKFGDKYVVSTRYKRSETPPKLASLAKAFMLKPAYPKDVLVAAVCKTYTTEHKNEWESNSSIPITYSSKGSNRKHTIYAYPEYSTERKQNKPRLLAPTHLLTNMRVHATTKNMVESQANAFLGVSKFNSDVLDRAITEDLMDKQSSKIAMKVFSKEVEDVMVLLEAEDEKKEMQKPECERRQIEKLVPCM